ncbi:MAG: TRAP transporter small permease [Dehalococcoidia bacterium]|nr:TRAP transporter small permease [Dehalococcoidia bacterium]MDH4299306.1 TRAP transporter small permease [Dehalococcoidia bacterium]MDH4366894.1 TRAP transporter small permease [Dehalococcoidia bacterium]
MFTKAARYINKAVSYPSDLLSGISMVAIVFVMMAVVVDVLGRWLFHSPLRGAWDIITLAFAVIVWGPMALAAFKGAHVALTVVVDRLPRLPRLGLELIIASVTSGMLGMLGWYLLMYGMRLARRIAQTGVLKIPVAPFVYFAAFGCLLMVLVFLARVPETIGKIRKEQ